MKMFKVILYLLCGLLIVNTSVAGEKSKSKRKNPEAFAKAEKALRSNDFVFHFDMFRLEGKQYSDANESENYLYIKGDSGMIVITIDVGRFYTVEDAMVIDGKVTDVDFKINKKGDLVYSAVITGLKGVSKFDIIVARDNNYATLKLNSNQIKGG